MPLRCAEPSSRESEFASEFPHPYGEDRDIGADNHPMAERARFFRGMLMITPVIAVGMIGPVHRMEEPEQVVPEYGKVIAQRIEAYRWPVAQVQELMGLGTWADEHTTVAVAESWAAGLRDGTLQELPMVHRTDTSRTGVKEQILTARDRLLAHLAYHADQPYQLPGRRVQLYRLGLEIAETLKGSDVTSVANALIIQNAYYQRLASVKPLLPSEEFDRLTADLPRTDRHEVTKALEHQIKFALSAPGLSQNEQRAIHDHFIRTVRSLEENGALEPVPKFILTADYSISFLFASAARSIRQVQIQESIRAEALGEQSPLLAENEPGTIAQNLTRSNRS